MDDTYWWQQLDSDEHWQWEETQRLNRMLSGYASMNAKTGQTSIKQNGIDGSKESDKSLTQLSNLERQT